MLISSIDLGTNTCLLLVMDRDTQGQDRVISDHSTVVRLGQGVDQSRQLHPDAMARTLNCLRGYSKILQDAGGDSRHTICVATSQARDAKNGADFFEQVKRETGFQFKIISGEEEARLTFLGALLPGMDPAKSVVIDIGGGSTEIISQNGGKSVDMGSVRFTERFLKSNPVLDAEFWSCQGVVDAMLKPLKTWREGLPPEIQVVGVAGSITTLASQFLGLKKFDARAIDGLTLSRGDIHRLVEELKWRTIAERKELPGIEPGRADVILAGALILWRILEELDFPEIRVTTRGLRYGVLSLVFWLKKYFLALIAAWISAVAGDPCGY